MVFCLWFRLSLLLLFLLPRSWVFRVRDRRPLLLWLLSLLWRRLSPVRLPWVVRGALTWLCGGFSRRLRCLRFRPALGVLVGVRSRLGLLLLFGRWLPVVAVCFPSLLLLVRLGCFRRGRLLAVSVGLVLALGRLWRSRWVWAFLVRCFFLWVFFVPLLGVWWRLGVAGSFLPLLLFPSCLCFSCLAVLRGFAALAAAPPLLWFWLFWYLYLRSLLENLLFVSFCC